MQHTHPDLARPIASHRPKIYATMLSFVGAVFVFMTVAVGTGLVAPTRTADIVANLIFGIPVMLLLLVLLWKASGENRSRLSGVANRRCELACKKEAASRRKGAFPCQCGLHGIATIIEWVWRDAYA